MAHCIVTTATTHWIITFNHVSLSLCAGGMFWLHVTMSYSDQLRDVVLSAWFGIFSSNHEELAASYFSTVFRQIPGAAAQAQRFLSTHGKNSCPATALKFQQHISAYGGGDLNTPWEITNGQFMQWTGSWTSLLFIE
eukprot:SAG11_NODE_11224_length_775_cov_1.286982_1_plen_136_part_10